MGHGDFYSQTSCCDQEVTDVHDFFGKQPEVFGQINRHVPLTYVCLFKDILPQNEIFFKSIFNVMFTS